MSDQNSQAIQKMNSTTIARILLLLTIACLAGLAGITAYWVARNAVLLQKSGSFIDALTIREGTKTPQVGAEGAPLPAAESSGSLSGSSAAPTLTPWDGAGRVTVLLIGLDYRDWSAEEGPSRSDTMILLTLDPLTMTAGVLSIPRDMWVTIPGFKNGKINTAYFLGESYKLPGGGPGLAVKTVENFLGVPINYYAQIDFGAFVKFIDEIGGVKIDVPEKITVDLLGGGPSTKKVLKPGVQLLPGEWALAYARARYTEEGDFDRARRQQQVIMGIRERILSLDMLPTLIAKAPELYSTLSSGIHTNLSLEQVIKLALMAKEVKEEDIQKSVIGKESVIFGSSPDNLSILIPAPDKIRLLRDQVFASSGSLSPMTPGSLQEQMQAEAASLAVLNGSTAGGLAQTTSDYLRQQGANIVQTGDAGKQYYATTIVDHTGRPFLVHYLAELMSVTQANIRLSYDPGASANVEVFLGEDWKLKNPLP